MLINMVDLCTGCLSSGRKLYFIGETGFYHLYSQILNEIQVEDLSAVCVRVCWECRDRLRSMQRFRWQVQRNYTALLQNIPGYGGSRLSTQALHVLSYPEVAVKHECEDSLTDQITDSHADQLNDKLTDSLTEEHCEPETFADSLSIQREDNEPLKKKKKTKIKLKKSSKVKKKRKIKSENEANLENGTDHEADHFEESHLQDSVQESHFEESELGESDVKRSDLQESDPVIEKKEDVEAELTLAQIKANSKPAKPAKPGKGRKAGVQAGAEGVRSGAGAGAEGVRPGAGAEAEGVRPGAGAGAEGVRPQCPECGKVFSSKKTYRYHLNVLHKGQNQYPCGRCGKVYQWKSNLGRHMRTHRAVDSGELYCAPCVRSFASVATFRQHLRISRRHVPEAQFRFSCELCGKRFVNKTRLRDHVDWEHLQRVKFRCKLCDKPFKCHTSLYVHTQNVHVSRERKDNLCHVCGKSYQNAAKLKYHITAMHSGETPYRCGECGAAFGWYSSLYRHTREVHYKMKGVKKGKKPPPPAPPPPALTAL